MVLTKDLQLARYAYANSEKILGDTLKKLDKAIGHLTHLKQMLKLGFVSQSCYQAYRKTTANYRKGLQLGITKARVERHDNWKIYDKMQLEYNKQNQKEILLQDTLQKLSTEQKQALKEYFLQSN